MVSRSDIQFCREHAPSGSTDLDQTPAQPDTSQKIVAPFSHTQSSVDESESISEDFDETANRKTYLVVLSSLGARNSDQTSIALASIYALPQGLQSCKTPGCHAVPCDSGFCVGCQNEQADGCSLPALEFPSEDVASSCGEVGQVPSSGLCDEMISSGLSTDEPETRSASQSGEVTCVDDTESQQLTDAIGSSSSSSHPVGVESAAAWSESLCRGPHCNNAGMDQFRGLCMTCYRTLLNVNFNRHYGVSPADTGADHSDQLEEFDHADR